MMMFQKVVSELEGADAAVDMCGYRLLNGNMLEKMNAES